MSIVGLAVFGSRARLDHEDDADVDLLAVTTDPVPATTRHGQVSVAGYPFGQIVRHARSGDLFALHVATEAKVIYEAWPVFDHIRDAFRYRNEYAREIRLASDTGWFLVRSGHRFGDVRSLNRRIAWCTRTILIATAAEQRRAIFSASGLGEFSGSTTVPELIRNKDNVGMDARIIELFRDVLRTFGTEEPPMIEPVDEQLRVFERDRNTPGMSAVRAVMNDTGSV